MPKYWRGPARKITPAMKRRMAELRRGGWGYRKIADKVGVYPSSVQYHLDPEQRRKAKCRAAESKRRRRPKADVEYSRQYIVQRYHDDPEFRRRYLGHAKRYQQKIRERNRSIEIPEGTRLRCPYCKEVWRPMIRGAGHGPHVPVKCPRCKNYLVKLPEVLRDATEEAP